MPPTVLTVFNHKLQNVLAKRDSYSQNRSLVAFCLNIVDLQGYIFNFIVIIVIFVYLFIYLLIHLFDLVN